MGEERAGGVEKTWSESGADVNQVCTIPLSHLNFLHVSFIGRTGWLSIGTFSDGSARASNSSIIPFSGRLSTSRQIQLLPSNAHY